MKNNRWEDHYTRRARNEKWLARSVYKLKEMDERLKLIHKGDRLLDIGCFPGSWSQYALRKAGVKGEIIGLDLNTPVHLSAPNFKFIQADVLSLDIQWLGSGVGHIDVVMSDMAPNTTGVKVTDAARSIALAVKSAEIAFCLLRNKGRFVCKILEGGGADIKQFRIELSRRFREVRLMRLKASRKRSSEVFLVGLGYRQKGG
jgi:23S rRNA (uridine2552-2'-O)-methyltransferase